MYLIHQVRNPFHRNQWNNTSKVTKFIESKGCQIFDMDHLKINTMYLEVWSDQPR